MMLQQGILYPWAYEAPFRLVHHGDAERGRDYLCFGCHGPVRRRGGEERLVRSHFYHLSGFCDTDRALHETAKAVICDSFLSAQEQGEEYRYAYPCGECRKPIGVNIAPEGAAIASEVAAVRGTRSDLVVTKPDGSTPRLILEVVVTHSLEAATAQKYRDSGIPVLSLYPTWETLEYLRGGVRGRPEMNLPLVCAPCREQAEERRRLEEERVRAELLERQRREALRARMRAEAEALTAGIALRAGPAPQIRRIDRDKFGTRLRRGTRERLTGYARKVAALGFVQQKRATLFLYRKGALRVYVDFDSTEVLKIWDANCPAIYSFPQEGGPTCRECVLELVGEKLEAQGVSFRRHFEDNYGHEHELPDAVSSEEAFDGT